MIHEIQLPSLSLELPGCPIPYTHQCGLLLPLNNKWYFVCLPDTFINLTFVCMCTFLQAWFLPDTPQIKGGGGGGESTALFEENLSLICCSCRGPFGQLKRTGFGSFPNEVTTCYTWIGHLRGTVGHRGIWLSFPLRSAWGKHTAARREKKRMYVFFLSCLVPQHQKVQQHPVRVGQFPAMWCSLGFGNESCTFDLLSFEVSSTYFCLSATIV